MESVTLDLWCAVYCCCCCKGCMVAFLDHHHNYPLYFTKILHKVGLLLRITIIKNYAYDFMSLYAIYYAGVQHARLKRHPASRKGGGNMGKYKSPFNLHFTQNLHLC